MRVRVRFRYNTATGEVEMFDIDDLQDGPRLTDHDARHDRAAAEVARVVETGALIEEVAPGTAGPSAATTATPATPMAEQQPETREASRQGE